MTYYRYIPGDGGDVQDGLVQGDIEWDREMAARIDRERAIEDLRRQLRGGLMKRLRRWWQRRREP